MKLPSKSQESMPWGSLRVWVSAAVALLLIGLIFYRASGPGEPERGGAQGSDPVSSAGAKDASEASGDDLSAETLLQSDPAELNRTNPTGKRDGRPGRTPLRITGMVADIDGKPLQGALLRWIPLGARHVWPFSRDKVLTSGDAGRVPEGILRDALSQSRATGSDADGRFVLEVDQLRQGLVAASKPGYETSLRSVGLSRSEVSLVFLLHFGGAISGTVTDGATGLPAQGMAVAAVSRETTSGFVSIGAATPAALVDSQGRYSLQGIAAGTYLIAPKTAGSPFVSVAFNSGKVVTIEAGSEIVNVDFEVYQGGRITGRAVSASGEAMPGVRCWAVPSIFSALSLTGNRGIQEVNHQQALQTGPDGRFDFRGLALDRSYRIRGSSADAVEALSDPVRLTAESPQATIDLVMESGSRISGQVVYKDGRIPNEGTLVIATVAVQDPKEPLMNFTASSARTDSQGSFNLGPFSAAQYRLRAMVRGRPSSKGDQAPVTVEVDGRSDLSGIVIILQEPDTDQISGVVVDDQDRPLEGAAIQASSQDSPYHSTASRPDGSFRLETTGEGPFQITAEKSNHSRAVQSDVPAGSRNLRLVLEGPGQVSGRVLLPQGDPPPQGGRVELYAVQEEGGSKRSAFVKPGEDGSFQMDIKAGQIELVARYEGFAPVRSGAVTVRSGEETGGVQLVLSAGSRLLGSVVFMDGMPVEGAQVTASSAGAGRMAEGIADQQAVSDRRGRFEMLHLQPGNYTVASTYPGYAPSLPAQIRLEENQQREVTLEISRGGALSGRVLDDGMPRPGLLIHLESEAVSLTAVTDDQGAFLIEGLWAADYWLKVQQINLLGRPVRKLLAVKIRDESVQQIEIDLADGQRISGTIRGVPSDAFCRITIRRPHGPSSRSEGETLVQSDGRYEILSVDPGDYLLEVHRLPKAPSDPQTLLYQRQIQVGQSDLVVNIGL